MKLWDSILSDLAGSGSTQKASTARRVLIVGPMFSGKRTLAAKLREATADKRASSHLRAESPSGQQARGPYRNGVGLEHSFVDVRDADGSIASTVEVLCCDTTSLIPILLPSAAAVANTFVLFVVDMSAPSTMKSALDTWRVALNNRVAQLVDSSGEANLTLASLVAERQKHWVEQSHLLKAIRQRQVDTALPGTKPNNAILLDESAVSLLPAFLIANKMDAFEAMSRGRTSNANASAGRMTPSQFAMEFLRKQALDLRCGFAAVTLRGASSGAAVCRALWLYLLDSLRVAYTEVSSESVEKSFTSAINTAAMQQLGGAEGGPSRALTEAVEEALSYDHVDWTFIPAGADVYELLSGQTRTGEADFEAYFPAVVPKQPELRSHDAVLKAAKEQMVKTDRAPGDDMWKEFELR